MFCDNASYDTERMAKNCVNYCSGQQGRLPSYNNIHTEQSQRNPSNYYQNFSNRQQRLKTQQHLQKINQLQTLQLMHENTKRENQQLKAITRNKRIAAILSTIIAFSQRIQGIKQKLAGYPGQSFSPVQFFNVLDLTQKGYVDLFDVKRFVNNQRITEKDILSLFKKVNGEHAKDSNRLTYFGYLNLIKPYFNEQLARDLLLRDSEKGKKRKKTQIKIERGDYDILQPTQQSVLLLFQQLMLLHCICTSEHELAKQDLMNDYMLNVIEIKQIVGLDHLQNLHQNISVLSKTPGNQHKTPLKVLFQFIENNSQFQIEFKEMKFLLSFLNAHQFSLTNQKYLSLLFIPMNCKNQLIKLFQTQNSQTYNPKPALNYMNTYLTKQNLINKGNIQPIRQYLQNGSQKMNLTKNHMALTSNSNKINFLQFVHPKSFQRISANNIPYQENNFPSEQYMDNPLYPPQQYIQLSNQHPQMQINPSNKYLSQNQSRKLVNPIPSQRQYSNSSSIPQQNIRINPPTQTVQIKQYPSNQTLNNQFYNQGKRQQQQMNISGISQTPFLQKFMKNNNNVKNSHIPIKNQKNPLLNQNYSKISQSKFSDSAFEVVDYGYEPSNQRSKLDKNIKNDRQQLKYPDQSQRFKKQSLDSRYNLVISQYKNSQLHPEEAKRQHKNQPYQQSSHYKNHGPKFEKSSKTNNQPVYNPVLDYSKGNYIDSVGLSQSNMVNQSNFMNKFYSNGGNILNEFLKK